MRKVLFIIFLLCNYIFVQAQNKRIDSLRQVLQTIKNDTNRVNALNGLAGSFLYVKPDTSLLLANSSLSLAREISFKRGEASSLMMIGNVFNLSGNYPRALQHFLEALKIADEMKNKRVESAVLARLADTYFYSGDIERSVAYSYRAIESDRQLGRLFSMHLNMLNLGDTYEKIGRLDSALILTKLGYEYGIKNPSVDFDLGTCQNNLANIYRKMGQSDTAMKLYRSASIFMKENFSDAGLIECYLGMANLFLEKGQADSAVIYAQKSYSVAEGLSATDGIMNASSFLASYYRSVRNIDSAFTYQSITIAAKDSLFSQQKAHEMQSINYEETLRQQQIKDEKEKSQVRVRQNALIGGLASLLIVVFLLIRNNRQKKRANNLLQSQKEQIDEKANELALQKDNLQKSYNNVELLGEIGRKITSSLSIEKIIGTVYDNVNTIMDASIFGVGIYHDETKTIDFPATYENGKALDAYSNSIYDQNRFAGLCFISGKEIIINDLSTEYSNYLQNIPTPIVGDQPASLIYLPLKVKEKMFGVITVQSFQKNAFTDYHVNMLRTIAIYAAIGLENAESFKKLNETVSNLKETQKQLIQSEKMASLGELTAGIAHEIQNPLNFVNNFSEVSTELTKELVDEVEQGNTEEVKAIAKDLIQNLEKINHHGKRADSIVKGMLQHSRSSSGQKELTDINALAEEYLRLSYHGLRAKDKSFNAKFETDFDPFVGKVEVIAQDIGRVVLNLINNAFYAVNERKALQQAQGEEYTPTVIVRTKKTADGITISVKDNGNGIPKKVLDKIFQPFFTTKPTGEGTGLGLSLSYDIIRTHGGVLNVDTKETEGTTFHIQLPI